MTGLPTLLVKLDDGTGTFPYDISSRVRLPDGYTITRGRADEFGEVQPSTLNITLENINGDFTYGSATYGCFVDQMIQVSLNAGAGLVKRFTGFVQSWPVAWPDGSDQFAIAAITATDRLSRLSRRKLRSMLEQEILADSPLCYYRLNEGSTAVTAGDSSGNGAPALAQANFFSPITGLDSGGPAVVFGGGVGPGTDGLTAATFGSVTGSRGKHLEGTAAPAAGTYPGLSVEVWFTAPAVIIQTIPLVTLGDYADATLAGRLQIFISSAGTTSATVVVGGVAIGTGAVATVVCDGLLHHACATFDGTNLRMYIDGAPWGTVGVGALTPTIASSKFSVGAAFGGTASHAVGFGTALSAARVLAHYSAGHDGFSTERSDQRIARLAGYAGIAIGAMSLEAGAQLAVPAQSTSGGDVSTAISAVNNSEGGLTFIRGDGNLVMQNRNHRALELTPVLSLTAIDVGPDAVPTVDMQKVLNYVEVTSAGTGSKQAVSNAASIAAHEQYPGTLSPLVATDAEGLDRANWVVTTQSTPQPRIPGVRIDLLSQIAGVQQSALTLELSDRITVTGLPSQTPGGTTALLVAEGWTETYKLDTWDMAVNTSNWEVFRAWLLDNATYSVLGTTTRLYF